MAGYQGEVKNKCTCKSEKRKPLVVGVTVSCGGCLALWWRIGLDQLGRTRLVLGLIPGAGRLSLYVTSHPATQINSA